MKTCIKKIGRRAHAGGQYWLRAGSGAAQTFKGLYNFAEALHALIVLAAKLWRPSTIQFRPFFFNGRCGKRFVFSTGPKFHAAIWRIGVLVCVLSLLNDLSKALEPEELYGFSESRHARVGALVLGVDGNFYGTTVTGGSSDNGTVFQLTTNGVLTRLSEFNGSNGSSPNGLVLGNDGSFYGTTARGGSTSTDVGGGTVFRVTTNGVLTTLAKFGGTNGAYPVGDLVIGGDGSLYGTTSGNCIGSRNDGSLGCGTVFRLDKNGVLATIGFFAGTNGSSPNGLVLGIDGNFYGTTSGGGIFGLGTVFKMTPNGDFTALVEFNGTNGSSPSVTLTSGGDGNFYGCASGNGSNYLGEVFQVATNGLFEVLATFTGQNGGNPTAELVRGRDGSLYGITTQGGGNNFGTVFRLTTSGALTTLVEFDGQNGAYPDTGLAQGNDDNLYGTTPQGGSGLAGLDSGGGTAFRVTTNGVLTTLRKFGTGAGPNSALVLGLDGTLYGTTARGGHDDVGTVFQLRNDGVLTVLTEFNGTNGSYPEGLVQGSDGSLYGATLYGGPDFASYPSPYNGNGTIFRLTTNGASTTLVMFSGANGSLPGTGLVQGRDGNMYGLTIDGGSSNAGTAFRVTTNGILTTLAEFHGPDGANPTDRVIQVEDGSFYGTTQHGGDYGMGTVFRVTTNGVLTSLVSFDSTNGALPDAGLVQGDDGNLYGETLAGGTSDMGTIFRVTTNGLLTKLAEFDYSNGAGPERGLVLGNDRSFYGIALRGGIQGPASPESSYGTVFKVTTNGILTTIVKFNGSNGANPGSPLVLGPDGRFYGTTFRGGPNSGGTIFRLAIAEFTSIDVQTGGAVMLNGTGPFNQAFSLWFTTDLALPYSSWTLLTRGAFNTNGHFSYSDKGASASVSRFYRLSSP